MTELMRMLPYPFPEKLTTFNTFAIFDGHPHRPYTVRPQGNRWAAAEGLIPRDRACGIRPSEAAALELEEDEPFPPERTTGRPLRRRSRTLWRSADGRIETVVPEFDAGRFHANFGANGELIRVITDEVHCSGDDGNDFSLRAGDWVTIPLAELVAECGSRAGATGDE